jgi:hypothetical protein
MVKSMFGIIRRLLANVATASEQIAPVPARPDITAVRSVGTISQIFDRASRAAAIRHQRQIALLRNAAAPLLPTNDAALGRDDSQSVDNKWLQ